MKILVLNCGSSSIKYQVFAMPEGEVLAKGLVQRIGEEESAISQTGPTGDRGRATPIADHATGLELAVELLTAGDDAPLHDVHDIKAVGHRVVHGGEHFTETAVIDDEVIDAIEAHVELAPLHNPPNLLGIRVARELLPEVPQVAVFDTAFHQTMPPCAYLYAHPRALYEQERIRRYGFHGTSHRYVAARAAAVLGRRLRETNLITCHLGNGASVAAIENGRSVDSSMGLTPLEGLVMGTRCGDIDPAIIFHLERTSDRSVDELDRMLNKQSGLLGLSGKSNDVRELLELTDQGDRDAAVALDVFCYRLKKYVGAYTAALGRVDALVFTAGVGENSPFVRERVCAGLGVLGMELDAGKNESAKGEADISSAGSRTRVLVVPTDEEKLIAQDACALVGAGL